MQTENKKTKQKEKQLKKKNETQTMKTVNRKLCN